MCLIESPRSFAIQMLLQLIHSSSWLNVWKKYSRKLQNYYFNIANALMNSSKPWTLCIYLIWEWYIFNWLFQLNMAEFLNLFVAYALKPVKMHPLLGKQSIQQTIKSIVSDLVWNNQITIIHPILPQQLHPMREPHYNKFP